MLPFFHDIQKEEQTMSNRILQRRATALARVGKAMVLVPGIVVGALYGSSTPPPSEATHSLEPQTPVTVERHRQADPVVDERPFEVVGLATPAAVSVLS
jgi:hypothetical protein